MNNTAMAIEYRSDDVTNEQFLIFQISIPDILVKSLNFKFHENRLERG